MTKKCFILILLAHDAGKIRLILDQPLLFRLFDHIPDFENDILCV